MGRRSREKGSRGEREAAKEFNKWFHVGAFRGRQFQGGEDSPDVKHALEGVHIEVKRVESFQLYKSLEQADEERGQNDVPMVLHRRNNKPWVVIIKLSDLRRLSRILYEFIRDQVSKKK